MSRFHTSGVIINIIYTNKKKTINIKVIQNKEKIIDKNIVSENCESCDTQLMRGTREWVSRKTNERNESNISGRGTDSRCVFARRNKVRVKFAEDTRRALYIYIHITIYAHTHTRVK